MPHDVPRSFKRTRAQRGVVIPVIASFPAEGGNQHPVGQHGERDADDGQNAGQSPAMRAKSDHQAEHRDDKTEVFFDQQQQQRRDHRGAQPAGVQPLEGNREQRHGEGDLVEVGSHRGLQPPRKRVRDGDEVRRRSTECAPAEQPNRRQ